MDLQSIILKILNKNQAHEELEQLKAWKSETAENLKLYQEINGIVEEGAQLASHKDFDVDAGYAKFRIQTKKSKDSNNWISALILLALLVATYFAYEQFNKEDLSPKIYIAETSNSTVSLKDGSIIHLNKGATLAEKSDFITSRLVDLEGEAFFEIERNESLPFKIFLKDDVFVEVLGTSFNIINEEEQIEVSVESGKVAFNAFGRKIILSQGDAIKKIDGAFVKFDKTDSNYLSWMTKELVFDDMLISEALIEIFHHFNVPVKLDGSIYQSNCRLSTKFRTESLDQILVELKTVVKLSFSKEDTNTYILKTVSCE